MTGPPRVGDPALRDILARYEIPAVAAVERVEAGLINHNWRVVCADSTRYFLRGYARRPSIERVLAQVRFQERLLAGGFPVARVIAGQSGSKVVETAGLPWVLFEYIDGREYDHARIEQTREAGRMLAHFHQLGAVVMEPSPGAPGESFADFVDGAPDEPANLAGLFGGKGVDEDLEFAVKWWRWFVEEWPAQRLDRLPSSCAHYDYHGRNVLFRGDRMVGLFDFDYAGPGWPVLDLSRGLFNFARDGRGLFEEEEEARISRRLRPEFAEAFLAAYEAITPLSVEERQAIPAMCAWNSAPSSYWYTRPYFKGVDLVARFKRDTSILRDVDADMRRLAKRFRWTGR